MLLRTKAELGVGVAILLGLLMLGRTLLSEHDARLMAESQAKVLTQSQQQNQQQIQTLASMIQQVKDDNTKQVSVLADAVKNLKTPNDQLAWIASQLKTQQPLSINIPANPQTPATVSIPQIDLPAITQQVQECKTCQLNLSSATQQLSYKDQQIQQMTNQLVSEKQIASNFEKAAKGGSGFQRFKRAAKWTFFGAIGGVAIVCGSGHCGSK